MFGRFAIETTLMELYTYIYLFMISLYNYFLSRVYFDFRPGKDTWFKKVNHNKINERI